MRMLLLNQYGTGDQAPTARLLEDLAEDLRCRGCAVRVASAPVHYEKRSRGWRRHWDEIRVHGRLLFLGLVGKKPDIVLSMTSPACLVITAGLVAWARGARHVHWVMDVYPDVAWVLGEIRSKSLFKLLQWGVRKFYHACDVVVALDEDMQKYLQKNYGVTARIIAPWSSWNPEVVVHGSVVQKTADWIWLYSGNLGRAHEFETLLEVQALLEKEGVPATLIFQGGGVGLIRVRQRCEELGLKKCLIRSYVPQEALPESLLQADVLIVTRRPETCGMLWPSKLGLASRLPRPLLWVGDTESSLAAKLKQRHQTGVFSPGQVSEIKAWLMGLRAGHSDRLQMPAESGISRIEGMGLWTRLLGIENYSC
jgi:colanic acid biosynthesis glycosyl transferase WcaI